MTANIFVNGVIGYPPESMDLEAGTMLSDVRRQYESFGDGVTAVNVYINSPGGDVYEGLAIYDYLSALSQPVTTIGEGRVFSIASIIFLAGNTRLLQPNASYLIHNPLAAVFGEERDMTKAAQEMRAIKDRLINIYASNSGMDRTALAAAMDEETTYAAEDAVSMGFANGLYKPDLQAVAFANFNFNNQTNMADQTKDRKTILDQIKELVNGAAKNEVESPAPEPAPNDDSNPDELEQIKAENETLKAQLDEIKAKQSETEGEKDKAEKRSEELAAEVTALKDSLKLINQKLSELEDMPAATVTATKPKPVNQLRSKIELPNDLLEIDQKFSNLLTR